MGVRNSIIFICVFTFSALLLTELYWLALLLSPILLVLLYDLAQSKHTLLNIYPLVGHFRYIFESIRPEIQQYFVESNLSGSPINREFRELVYQRAKKVQDTRPFGTQFDVYESGYEWITHSLSPVHIENKDPRVLFGADCEKPYSASVLNISAMSYGALSKHAIMALNKGAQLGGFAHNTGEGGLSPHHLKYGGDIIWQIGTGYFGCRNDDGNFDAEKFTIKSQFDVVKMIEIKLSQGAKPGHGGILPAAKLTPEIAEIRHVPLGQDVVSPPAHSAFNTPTELLYFVKRLRELSGGKPVGFKLCIGNKREFLSICKAMLETGITPDFITVDGSEGGTGAAPIEFTNSVGMPLNESVVFVNGALIGVGLREKVRVIASAKIFSAFHVARIIALGADTVNSARGMMLALGCIQSRSCNTDKCPTGIATQDPRRYKFLDIESKGERVFNFHKATLVNLTELMGACGLHSQSELNMSHVYRRLDRTNATTYEKLYPVITPGCLLENDTVPEIFLGDWQAASANKW
jgi:glutamate synthase domain-containing protein 2